MTSPSPSSGPAGSPCSPAPRFVPIVFPDGSKRVCGCGMLFEPAGAVHQKCLCAGLDLGHCDDHTHDEVGGTLPRRLGDLTSFPLL